ncbi:MAG: hypothetical protein R2850_13355, partial [Bacteroidia bacterium]
SSLPILFLSDNRDPLPAKFNEDFLLKWLSPAHIIQWTFQLEDQSNVVFFPDSMIELSSDLSKLSAKANLTRNRNRLSALFELSAESSKFNKKTPRIEENGSVSKVISSGFMSPGILRCQSGISLKSESGNYIDCGFPAAKIAWISMKSIYELNKLEEIAGVPKNKSHSFEGGFSLNSSFSYPENKWWKLENRSWLFYPLSKSGNSEARVETRISMEIRKSLRAALSNRYSYNATRWPPGLWITEMSICWEKQ